MNNKRKQLGFTMAELLIVVAIIGVLAGVAFVAVQRHQESLNQVELDTVAKEIYVAAQNHLTVALNENYMGMVKDNDTADVKKAFYGDSEDSGYNICYITVEKGTPNATIFSQMLPPYALDATVLAGNYVIRYQPKAGLVLDVFYASPTGRYATDLPDYSDLIVMSGDEKRENRRSAHIGWYGGTEAASLPTGETLVEPLLEVINDDKLIARITDKNTTATGYKLALLLTGKVSGAQQVYKLGVTDNRISSSASPFDVTLDDITSPGMHFGEIVSVNSNAFIPGEDIVLLAVAYNESALSNIAYSDEKTVNSLFEKAENADGSEKTTSLPIKAYVNNIRHLENLCYAVSNVNYWPSSSKFIAAGGTNPSTIAVQVEQTGDIAWGGLFDDDTQICNVGATTDKEDNKGKEGCFVPVNVSETYTVKSSNVPVCINYDGKLHSIDGITVKVEGNASAGLFGDLLNDSSVKDLMLIDFDVQSLKGDAGALSGTLIQDKVLPKNDDNVDIPNVSNVVASNINKKGLTATVLASGTDAGNAGGLIGYVKGGKAAIEKSAAALVVRSTGGNAGGLIGTMAGGTLTDCYSGGHTNNGNYFESSGAAIYNVQAATGTAGGLIGVATGMGDVKSCYSTCSATGAVAGGFAGTYAGADGAALSNCYATGLVCGTGKDEDVIIGSGDDNKKYTAAPKDGAFAYSLTGLTTAKVQGCHYYEIINERVERETNTEGSYSYEIIPTRPTSSMTAAEYPVYLTAFGKLNKDNSIVIAALDSTAGDYNAFVGQPDGWNEASPYDGKLMEYYSVKETQSNGQDKDGNEITKEVMVSRYNLKGIKRLDNGLDDDDFVATHYGDWPAPEIFVVNTK